MGPALMEHFDEDRLDERKLHGVLIARWSLGFAALFLFVLAALWWSGSAVRYGASRVHGSGAPSYRISGVITDSVSKRPIPWASVTTEITFGPQFFETNANSAGAYSLLTMAEPHTIIVRANGYRDARIHVGKQWFAWLPRGEEHKNISLEPRP